MFGFACWFPFVNHVPITNIFKRMFTKGNYKFKLRHIFVIYAFLFSSLCNPSPKGALCFFFTRKQQWSKASLQGHLAPCRSSRFLFVHDDCAGGGGGGRMVRCLQNVHSCSFHSQYEYACMRRRRQKQNAAALDLCSGSRRPQSNIC